MKRIKKISLILVLFTLSFFLFSCKQSKTEYDVMFENVPTYVDEFNISNIKIHIKDTKVDALIDVTKDMISSSDLEKLKESGNHQITINFKNYSTTLDISLIDKPKEPDKPNDPDPEEDEHEGVYFDMAYYSDANGKYGEELKLALRAIISVTTKTETYDQLRTDLATTDKGSSDNTIICFYCRKEMAATWDGGKTWNREHVWPQSLGWFSTTMAGADIHHLRPCHQSENSSRGNTPYGTSSGYYEPKDEVKGDVARILFYMYTRYQEADRYPLNTVCESFEMLLLWNEADPVDALEIQRNEQGYSIQGNRNPFIDYPAYADYIWGSLS